MTLRAALPEAVYQVVLERILSGGAMIEIDQKPGGDPLPLVGERVSGCEPSLISRLQESGL